MKFKLLNILLAVTCAQAQAPLLNSVKNQTVEEKSKLNLPLSSRKETLSKQLNIFLNSSQIQDLRDSFKPVLEVPSKFLKFRSLWYEGNNRQQMANILLKEKIKRADLARLIELLNLEEKRLGYKATVIVDAVNGVIMKKFLRELSHLMPLEEIEKEAQAKFISATHLVEEEKSRHKKIVEYKLVPLMTSLPLVNQK